MKMMKTLLLYVLAAAILLCTGCQNTGVEEQRQQQHEAQIETEAAAPSYTQIDQESAKKIMDENPAALILDVREEDEFAAAHIPGALLLPVGTITDETAAATIPTKDTVVLVYCRSGNRSKTASQALADLGYTEIYEFGGINTWPYGTE